MTGIDDLLRYEDAGPPTAGSRRGGRMAWPVTSALVSAVLAAVSYAALRMLGVGVPAILIFVLIYSVLVLRRVLASVRPGAPPPSEVPGYDGTLGDWDTPDGLYSASAWWDMRLTASRRDGDRFAAIVTPLLVELVEQRLRLRHGVNWHAEPERARKLVGDPLWTFLRGERDAPPGPREMAAIVARLESL